MPLSPPDARHLLALRQQTKQVLRTQFRGASSVALLDLPTHRNLGDSLIWAGEERYLAELGIRVLLRRSRKSHRDEEIEKLPPDTTLLLHGGGNVGDLWPLHDQYRQHLVDAFPARRILVAPQSVHYRNDSWAEHARTTYGRHSDIAFLVRDQASMERLRRAVPGLDVAFCPDAALGFSPPRTRPATDGVLVLARKDHEVSSTDGSTANHPLTHSSADWTASPLNTAVWRLAAKLVDPSSKAYRYTLLPQGLSTSLAGRTVLTSNVSAAVAQLARADALATNRLHAHILACLMGIPNFVSDNSYGKISGVFAYTNGFSTAHMASSLEEAASLALEAHRSQRRSMRRSRPSTTVR